MEDIADSITVSLIASGSDGLVWVATDNPSDTLAEGSTFSATISSTTSYILKGECGLNYPFTISIDSCLTDTIPDATDSTSILDSLNNNILFIPNSFSPNGDSKNDLLFVYAPNLSTIEWIIHDKFGKKVFYTTDIKQGWNGTYYNKPVNEGNYIYTLKAKTEEGGPIFKKGSITVVR